ncbi:unnamed protein product [Rotaria sordida]|uniref:Uncharacterized protein n=1 Tax=Rotaria sordida TaxID=392033 RepID=A0A815H604_9BILA|nr:unnamed protein product [Rotaria sordida]CAF1434456.1 unnamed protein product [Rotaria sordida]
MVFLASVLCGIARAAMGTAQCSYVAALGRHEADIIGSDRESMVKKYFAIFFSALQSSQIWGNLIAYHFLQDNSGELISRNLDLCGANYLDSGNDLFSHHDNHVSTEIKQQHEAKYKEFNQIEDKVTQKKNIQLKLTLEALHVFF